jgi:mycothiol synthase
MSATGAGAAAVAGPAPDGNGVPDGKKLPQLKMQITAAAALQPVRLPDGYSLATLAERDVSEWIAVLNANGQLGAWDAARAERCFTDPRPVLAEGTFLIMHGGRAVATTCTVQPTPAETRHELGWVAVDPAHQGKGLGLQVCAAVLCYARRRGWPVSILNTDDWRLPAIKTYLKLGFAPEITHHSHPARWQEIHRLLGTAAAAAPAPESSPETQGEQR